MKPLKLHSIKCAVWCARWLNVNMDENACWIHGNHGQVFDSKLKPESAHIPVMVDSSEVGRWLKRDLNVYGGKGIGNSISLKGGWIHSAGQISETIWGCPVVMAFDEQSKADTYERKNLHL